MCSNFENITPEALDERAWKAFDRAISHGGIGDLNRVWPKQPATLFRMADDGHWSMERWRWSLVPFWSKEGPAQKISTYNARAETIHSAPAYRGPWRSRRRCLVPAAAWYEPAKTLGRKGWAKIQPTAPVITFGGVWDTWQPREGSEPVHTFAIITVPPAPSIAHVHNRMPLIIPAAMRERWLSANTSADEARSMLLPVEDDYAVA